MKGVSGLGISYDLLATVRTEQGEYQDIWLPWAGAVWYSAHYTDGYHTLPNRVAVIHDLTPLGKLGRAHWNITLACEFLSLFRRSNADILERVRSYWQTRLTSHPLSTYLDDDAMTPEQPQAAEVKPSEAYFMTLADPPHGTPSDNQALYERNWPRLQTAVLRWEQWIDRPFQWAL